MKQGRPLPEVLKALQAQNSMKRDYIAPATALSLSDDGETFILDRIGPKDTELLGTTDLFHRQMGSALNIPAKYYDAMRMQKPELLARNVYYSAVYCFTNPIDFKQIKRRYRFF